MFVGGFAAPAQAAWISASAEGQLSMREMAGGGFNSSYTAISITSAADRANADGAIHATAVASYGSLGATADVNHQASGIYALAKKHGGLAAGEEHGRRGYMLTYAIAYIRDFLLQYHVIGETFETTAPWSKIETVCSAVALIRKPSVCVNCHYRLCHMAISGSSLVSTAQARVPRRR
jgi:hypothetical protein